jgi:hypothetical protein
MGDGELALVRWAEQGRKTKGDGPLGSFSQSVRHCNFNFGPHLKSKMKQESAHQYSSHHAELLKTQDLYLKNNTISDQRRTGVFAIDLLKESLHR